MTETLSDLQMWSLLVGFFLPLAIAVIQQPKWSAPVRAAVTFVVCALAGAGTAYLNGSFEGRPLISTILLVLVTALSSFKGLWKPTEIAGSVERLTSPGSPTDGLPRAA